MPWATPEECAAITGTTPDDATLVLAHATIRAHINRTEAEVAALVVARDLEWLREAVAWQAAWLPGQPGILQRVGVQGVNQDGLNAQYRSAADQVVAPLAQRALKNLSWMGSRSLRTSTRTPRASGGGDAGLTAESWPTTDPEHGWQPL